VKEAPSKRFLDLCGVGERTAARPARAAGPNERTTKTKACSEEELKI